MGKRTILVVDDEPKLVKVVREYLEHDGYRVVSASDGREALKRFHEARPDLVVLDLMLPEVDGLEVCRRLRRDSGVPIIMLTARAEEVDELVGLELGADDYVTKPFSPRALLARICSVLRRATPADNGEAPLSLGPLRVDPSRHEATWEGAPLALTPTEFRLLAALARIEELVVEDWVLEDTAERVRGLYNDRRSRFSARFGGDADGIEESSAAYQRLLRELLRAQRRTLLELRNQGVIGDEAMHRIERDLDLEESRMEA